MAFNKEQKHEWYIQNKEQIKKKVRQWQTKWMLENPLAYKYSRYKRQACTRNIDFNLSKNEFGQIISQPCFYCGELQEKFNGIDRFNNDEGYYLDNCVSCCRLCNKMKTNSNVNTFLKKCREIMEKQLVIS